MGRLPEKMILVVAILSAGYLAAGCGSGSVKNAVSSAAASKSISVSPPTFSPGTRSPRPSPSRSTVQPTVTASAVAPAPAPAPSAESLSPSAESLSPSPVASGGSASSLLWLWILLGAVVIVGVAVWLARRSGKRSAMATSWRSKVVDASAKGSALADMMRMAESPAARAAEDASARWAEIQRRMDDLAQELYALRETAPGEAERERVADVLASLQAVRSAMDADRAPGGAGPEQGARVRGLLLTFEASLRALRSPGEDGAPM